MLGLGPLVEKERLWLWRNRRAVLLVFVLLPALLGVATLSFERTLPEDVPVAVAPADESVTRDERQAVAGLAGTVAAPRRYDDPAAARAALDQERVYGVMLVRHGLYDPGANVTLTLLVDGAMVTYAEPSQALVAGLRGPVDAFPATVTIERAVDGPVRTLSEYLFAVTLVVLPLVYAFTYVPHHLTRERAAFERVRTESSLGALLAAKCLLFGAFGVLVIATMGAVGSALGYRLTLAAPVALAALAMTGTAAAAVALGVAFLTRFSVTGRFLNVALLLGVVLFSNLVYPRGFFSPLRRDVATLVPTYHAGVVVRSLVLTDASPAAFADRLLALAGVTVLALAWLAGSVAVYQRRA